MQVKEYIDDSIVQNFYHNGDNIGTQVKDSIVQHSNIGPGAAEKSVQNAARWLIRMEKSAMNVGKIIRMGAKGRIG